MPTYGTQLSQDSANKKFLSPLANNAGANVFTAPAGANYRTQNGEVVSDLVVQVTETGGLGATIAAALIAGVKEQALWKIVQLLEATPNPAGNDIVMTGSGAPAGTDMAIRNTSVHAFWIPMAVVGYREVSIQLIVYSFDQAGTINLYGNHIQDGVAGLHASLLASATIASGLSPTSVEFGVGAVGQGGTAGGSSIADKAFYNVPAMAGPWAFLTLALNFSVAPTAGAISALVVSRRS